MKRSRQDINRFQRLVYNEGRKHARLFAWREPSLRTRKDGSLDPYKILVSEIMLQQTQTARVAQRYPLFIKRFPSVRALAGAPLADVLIAWQGLGYNRRAKALHQCAQEIVRKYRAKVPRTRAELEVLPGIGPYTAAAVRVFAFNEPEAVIETNIRTVLFRHFYQRIKRRKIPDSELLQLTEVVMDRKNPRAWYTALMDYGAALKANGVRLNEKSKHYAKQSRFEGSDRQIRGAILRELAARPTATQTLCRNIGAGRSRVKRQLAVLEAEGFIQQADTRWALVM